MRSRRAKPRGVQYLTRSDFTDIKNIRRYAVPDYFNIPYLQDYFTPAMIKIFFGDICIADAVMLSYVIQDNKRPIYGYSDRFMASVEEGNYLVSGQFAINFKEVGYLPVVLDLISNSNLVTITNDKANKVYNVLEFFEHKFKGFDRQKQIAFAKRLVNHFHYMFNISYEKLARFFGFSNGEFDWNNFEINYDTVVTLLRLYKTIMRMSIDPYFGETPYTELFNEYTFNNVVKSLSHKSPVSPVYWESSVVHNIAAPLTVEDIFTESSIEGLFEYIEDTLWGYTTERQAYIKPVMQHDMVDVGYGYGTRALQSTFDIIIRYGEEQSTSTDHTIQVINDVHITSEGQMINIGQPDVILTSYEFFARTVNEKVLDESGVRLKVDLSREGAKYNLDYLDFENLDVTDKIKIFLPGKYLWLIRLYVNADGNERIIGEYKTSTDIAFLRSITDKPWMFIPKNQKGTIYKNNVVVNYDMYFETENGLMRVPFDADAFVDWLVYATKVGTENYIVPDEFHNYFLRQRWYNEATSEAMQCGFWEPNTEVVVHEMCSYCDSPDAECYKLDKVIYPYIAGVDSLSFLRNDPTDQVVKVSVLGMDERWRYFELFSAYFVLVRAPY